MEQIVNKLDTLREGNYRLEITYGPDEARKITRMYNNNILEKTKYYAGGNYEVEVDASGNERKLHYIYGSDGLAAIFEKTSFAENMYYIHKDHLGSFTAVTDESGVKVDSMSFDPWGRRRNPANWTFDNMASGYLFDRGYTGHEHLDDFSLINMNGRVYDPLLGRFMSPDNYIQAPDYTQSLNRYSYCLNNPLIYIDPTGEKWSWPKFRWGYLIPVIGQLDYIFETINMNTAGLSQKMVDAGVPPFGLGNDGNGWYHYVGNSGNIYHNPPGNNANSVVNDAINNARAEYFSYHNFFISSRDATLIVPQFYSGSPLQENTNIFGLGDAISVYNAIMPENKKIPVVGFVLTGIDVYNHIEVGNYTEATWSLIESVGGPYSVAFKGLAYGYNSNYMQTEIGRGFYNDYIYNLNLYRQSSNEKYLNNAIYYERLMRKTYNNMQRK